MGVVNFTQTGHATFGSYNGQEDGGGGGGGVRYNRYSHCCITDVSAKSVGLLSLFADVSAKSVGLLSLFADVSAKSVGLLSLFADV